MALVAHRYMTEEMSEEELRATFAAREHTLEFLLDRLREQTQSKTLTSFLVTGPRGSGKTTIVLMLYSCIQREEALRDAWLPVRFPEELQGISSLRDLLVASLHRLADDHGIPTARQWYDKAEAEMDDEQSLEFAISGLREIAAQTDKRTILFVENLDQVFERKLTAKAQATLRRLLMVDPFLTIVGTSVRMFEAVQGYEAPFFNYFSCVPLERLNDEQVYQVLAKRAKSDGAGTKFFLQYREHKAKIQAITRLTGGNPRLLLLLYELLSEGKLGSTVTALRQVVDELTPLLKDVLQNQFTEQQSKIVDALMRAGGSSTPRDIAKSSRLSLNKVTTQLKRMKDMQVVEVRGGGKGHTAYYSIPDPLFRTWYQLRYLRPNKRRIEVFVEVLRLWFEEEAKLNMLRGFARRVAGGAGKAVREDADTAEYFAASLTGSRHASEAEGHLVGVSWHVGGMREAAMALADMKLPASAAGPQTTAAYADLGEWCRNHGDLQKSIEAMRAASERETDNLRYQLEFAVTLGMAGSHQEASETLDRVIEAKHASVQERAMALCFRGVSRRMLGDTKGSIRDYTQVVDALEAAPAEVIAARNNRAESRYMLGDAKGAIEDFTYIVEMPDASPSQVSVALNNRGIIRDWQGDWEGAIEDFTRVVQRGDTAPPDQVAEALYNRGVSKGLHGDADGAVKDYTRVVDVTKGRGDMAASALLNRGVMRGNAGNSGSAYADFMASLGIENVLTESRVAAGRGALQAALLLEDNAKLAEATTLLLRSTSKRRGEEGLGVVMQILRSLASAKYRAVWASVWRALLEACTDKSVIRGMEPTRPVAEVLETGDWSKLDPLPPDERAFAEELLGKFGEGQ